MEAEAVTNILMSLSNPVLAIAAVIIAKNLSELNTKMAVIIERVDSHEKRLSYLEYDQGGK